jgi:hypothetical protein
MNSLILRSVKLWEGQYSALMLSGIRAELEAGAKISTAKMMAYICHLYPPGRIGFTLNSTACFFIDRKLNPSGVGPS